MNVELDKINLSPKTLEDAVEVIGHLVKIIIELKKENDSLRDQLNNNSSNSSLPPSRDFKKKKTIKPKSGRNRGAQTGHKVFKRHIVPADQVDAMVDCKPPEQCCCGGNVRLENKIRTHQVFEIPLPKYEVTEYRIYRGCCEACNVRYQGKLPAGVTLKGFGSRALAMVSLLTSKYRLSKRLVKSWFQDVYKMPICIGSVSNAENTVSKSLKTIHEAVLAAVKNEPVVNVDETGHRECNKNGWAWIVGAPTFSCFVLRKSRGKKVAKEVIGNPQGRTIVTDRYPAYNFIPPANHQICWAHLKRDFQKMSERPGKAGRIGRALQRTYDQLFIFWKTDCNPGEKPYGKKRRRMGYLKRKLLKELFSGLHCGHAKTERTCENILAHQGSLWHFFDGRNIPPTNNHAERQLRPLVISKKLTFGTQSDRGSRFIERIFTVTLSCAQQGRDVLAFLREALNRHFHGEQSPELVSVT